MEQVSLSPPPSPSRRGKVGSRTVQAKGRCDTVTTDPRRARLGSTQMASIQTKPAAAATAQGQPLTDEQLARLRGEFAASAANRLAQNAVTQVTVDDVALNRSIVTAIDHSFSHRLDDWAVTNQKRSGRCWMFAGLNLFRVGA